MKDINKDIENLEEIINLINKELDKKDKNVSAILDLKDLLSLRNLIKAYKELEEENKIVTGNYYTLCADIQMVISELGFPEDTIIADEFVSMIKENYIEKSLVEEKIEEIDKIYKGIPEDEGNFAKAILIKEKQVLQELLEKRK